MSNPAEFSWLTELRIQVAYGTYPGEPPDEVFLLATGSPQLDGEPWDDDGFVAELETLTWAESDTKHRYQLPYDLSVRKGHFSWGADGATGEILMYIANSLGSGGMGAVGGAAAMAALDKLRAKVGARKDEASPLQTRDELAEHGEACIRQAFRDWLPDREELTLVEESSVEDEWSASFRDTSGNEYAVTLRPGEGHPYRVRISRNRRSRNHDLDGGVSLLKRAARALRGLKS